MGVKDPWKALNQDMQTAYRIIGKRGSCAVQIGGDINDNG